jgi:hypothetical protein
MAETAEVLKIIRNLLASQRLAVLSTQNQGQPYSNLVSRNIFSSPPPEPPASMPICWPTREYPS